MVSFFERASEILSVQRSYQIAFVTRQGRTSPIELVVFNRLNHHGAPNEWLEFRIEFWYTDLHARVNLLLLVFLRRGRARVHLFQALAKHNTGEWD